jgi:hypothetical protein
MAHHITDDEKGTRLGRRKDGRYITMEGEDITCKCCCNHKGTIQDKNVAEPKLICTRCHNAKYYDNIRDASKQTAEGDAELARMDRLHDPSTEEYERAAAMKQFCEENKMTKEEIDDERAMNLGKPRGTAHDPNHCGPKAKTKSPFVCQPDSNDDPVTTSYYNVRSTPIHLDDSREPVDEIAELRKEIEKLKKDKGT